jgi:hypothetical protein
VNTAIPGLVGTLATSNPVQVQLEDANGNNLSTSGVPVTIGIGSGTGSAATLSGTTTENTDGTGVATFTDLSINQVGRYQLVATSPGYTSTTSGTSTSAPGVGPFAIGDNETTCPSGSPCSTSGSSADGTSYSVSYTNNSGSAEILLSGLGQETFTCGHYTPSSDSLLTGVYFAASGGQDANAVTTNDVTDSGATWMSTDQSCFSSTMPIPASSVASGYACDPNTTGNACQTTLFGETQYQAVLNPCSPAGAPCLISDQPANPSGVETKWQSVGEAVGRGP